MGDLRRWRKQHTQGQTRWSIPLPDPRPSSKVLRGLARAFLSGDATVEGIVARSIVTLGRPWRWLRPLANRYVAAFGGGVRPRIRDVVRFLTDDPGVQAAWVRSGKKIAVANWIGESPQMQPVDAAMGWDLPPLETVDALCAWLGITPEELEWLADRKGLTTRPGTDGRLRHYHCRVLMKQFGRVRLIEAPKERLKTIQRKVLVGILERVPVHPAVHGFVKGRSIQTFVAPHVGKRVVLRMDLEDFFPTLSGPRIEAMFRTLGYPEAVADALGSLCTNVAPGDIWRGLDGVGLRDARTLYKRPHLPQGAPTSPALANLGAYRVDCRLRVLARSAGAVYTRYADDLAFSGDEDFDRRVERFSLHVAAVLMEEGFRVHHRKTRIMRRGVRQHLAGLVTNERVNIARTDYDLLKATLTNCRRHGPESQNREAHPRFREHLEGRVGFVATIHPEWGAKLRAILEGIAWDA